MSVAEKYEIRERASATADALLFELFLLVVIGLRGAVCKELARAALVLCLLVVVERKEFFDGFAEQSCNLDRQHG